MTNPETPASSGEPNASQLLAEAKQVLEEIKRLKGQAEERLKEAEAASQKANSEAGFAFNAKNHCEEHATTIAGIKGTVETDANAIATIKQRSDDALASLTAGKATVDSDIKVIDDRRKEVDQSAINIVKAAETGAARLDEIEASRTSAQGAVKTADDSSKATTQASATAAQAALDADAAQKRAEKSFSEAATFTATISENLQATKQHVAETQNLLTQAQTAETNLKTILEHLAKSDEISTGHEGQVKALESELQTLMARVEGLLPGAASAGLASSFNKQKSRFERPQKLSLIAFVTCIGILVALAIPSFLSAVGVPYFSHPSDQTWNGAWRNFVLRLPIVLPIIWLAIYAGRNYMLSIRMEEDYAYKEAISTAFEGYKREMQAIAAGDTTNPTPLTTLCTNILRAIAERPGRIYEGTPQDINLMAEIQSAGQKTADFSKKKLATH